MTSKHFLVKYMLEDLRHRLWMLALSVLGSFLCMPVAYLLVMGSYRSRYERYLAEYGAQKAMEMLQSGLTDYFQEIGLGLNGAVAICGAIIVGLFGFRYVFRQDMVDTYHSVPVKRSTLFWIHYIDGFLLWFVPFLVCGALTLILAASDIAKAGAYGQMLGCALTSGLTILVSFLTIYSLVFLGVMLAGNFLNALVVMGFVGLAASAVYLVIYMGLESYMTSFWQMPVAYEDSALWLSPAISAVWVLIYRAIQDTPLLTAGLIIRCLIALLTAVVMLAAALLVYLKRPCEAAGQGVYRKDIAAVMRMVTAIVAGFGGWWFFSGISSEGYVAWGVFGAILVSFLTYGVLDIVFTMDFKAFWRHKIPMAVSVVCTVLIGLSFYFDWYGYDGYLPEKEQIQDMGIYLYSSSYRYNSRNEALTQMHYTDVDTIYAVLENGSGNTADVAAEGSADYAGDYVLGAYGAWYETTEDCIIRVTLKNGRSYYRYYVLDAGCQEALTRIAQSDDYVSIMYTVADIAVETCDSVDIYREDMEYYTTDAEETRLLLTALKEDLDTCGTEIIFSDRKIYCRLRYGYWDEKGSYYNQFSFITEDYVNTIAALKELGQEAFVEEMDPETVEYVEISCTLYASDFDQTDDILEVLGSCFGVDMSGETLSLDSEKYADLAESLYGESSDGYASLWVDITDTEDIEELLSLCDYYSYPSYPSRRQLFCAYSDAGAYVLLDNDGGYTFSIPYGKMPKEYILRLAAQLEED